MSTTPFHTAALLRQQLDSAAARLAVGRLAEARALLEPLLESRSLLEADAAATAHGLLGRVLDRMGDSAGAERELRASISSDKKRGPVHVALADILARAGQAKEAERSYRVALALNRRDADAVLGLTSLLLKAARAAEALQVTTPLAADPRADELILTAHAQTLKALGRAEAALSIHRRAIAAAPFSGVAEHNLAATAGDLSQYAEAEAGARRAFGKGLDAPETWMVLGRALQGQGRLDEAEDAFRQALRRRPAYLDAHRAAAQLIWMRTEDVGAAKELLDQALRTNGRDNMLLALKSSVLSNAGDPVGAYGVLAEVAQRPDPPLELLIAASRAAAGVDARQAKAFAEQALSLQGGQPTPALAPALMALCEAELALGDGARAGEIAGRLHEADPLNQHALAYLATAWRMTGDRRCSELYDYDAFVRSQVITKPAGWPDLASYLRDLARTLDGLHTMKGHPLGQSLRAGTQTTQDLEKVDDPALRALFAALDAPIKAYMAALGNGRDLLRSRNRGKYAFAGVWSVRLRPGGGRHVDHVHQKGWLSSAFYVDVPSAVNSSSDRSGWIKFGQPGVPTSPSLPAEWFVKPEPGMLVLFPSYMWHGTTPFTGDAARLTVAFDLVPA